MEFSDEVLKGALPRLARASIEEVFAAVGRSEIKASDVARAMYPDYREERAQQGSVKGIETGWFGLKNGDVVSVRKGGSRALVFGNVVVRTGGGHEMEMHIDTDEANAAGMQCGEILELIR